ncbi:hypothetical protein MT325_m613L [Paramecium bursaria chlorella virus MT325]|uniref:Uncharacterized protein m613L n=1 Tax=Paramecium bursaria Chlorella virus MT325 TaxID=346932 RepID=A7IUZ3_PBCVM|nr:hypothetical protein MT325_m613L [Paramecium bursaria chlorella virus MT325]
MCNGINIVIVVRIPEFLQKLFYLCWFDVARTRDPVFLEFRTHRLDNFVRNMRPLLGLKCIETFYEVIRPLISHRVVLFGKRI